MSAGAPDNGGEGYPEAAYRAAAMRRLEREGELEFDDLPLVSIGSDDGAYVQAWVWVGDEDITEEDLQ